MDTQWNNLAFNPGPQRLKNELATWDEPLHSFNSLTIKIGNCLPERCWEQEDILSKNKLHSFVGAPVQLANSLLPSTQPTEDKPMKLEEAKLTPHKRLCRIQAGEILYCGHPITLSLQVRFTQLGILLLSVGSWQARSLLKHSLLGPGSWSVPHRVFITLLSPCKPLLIQVLRTIWSMRSFNGAGLYIRTFRQAHLCHCRGLQGSNP